MYHGETKNSNNPMFVAKQSVKHLSYEYIRGLTDGEGCFTFYRNKYKKANNEVGFRKIPAFAIRMHHRDKNLLEMIRETLGLKNIVYLFRAYNKDGQNHNQSVSLVVRNIGELKNIIVPLFYNSLKGFKGIQFNNWLDKIGEDPEVLGGYDIIYRLHKNGYYAKNPKFS